MWRYDTKCKYMFRLSLKNLARKGLSLGEQLILFVKQHLKVVCFVFEQIDAVLGCLCRNKPLDTEIQTDTFLDNQYNDIIMSTIVSQITSLTIVHLTCLSAYSGADQRKHQRSMSLAFVRGIHQWTVNSPHKGPVTLKMFPFDDVIMIIKLFYSVWFSQCYISSAYRSVRVMLMKYWSKNCWVYQKWFGR